MPSTQRSLRRNGSSSCSRHKQPELAELRHKALLRSAVLVEEAGRFDHALQCYEEDADPRIEERARCLEQLIRWEEGANLYEDDGRKIEALRCVREIPDLDRARTLAAEVDPSIAARLGWARSLDLDDAGLVRLGSLEDALGLTVTEVADLTRKLGTRPIGDPARITDAQADRVRRRVAATSAEPGHDPRRGPTQ